MRKMISRLSTVTLLLSGGAVLASAGPAQAAYSDQLTSIGTSSYGLVWHATDPDAITALDNALPNVSLSTVVAGANHSMPSCGSDETASLPITPATAAKLCWDAGDAATEAWNPQGITSTGDADDDGALGDNRVILSGWQYTGDDRVNDARVAFIDYRDPAQAKYRWAYLVAPNATGSNFAAAKAHLGGMILYADKLLVTAVGDSTVAVRVFSLSHILQMTDSSATIGKTSSGWAAYGYQYALPQIGYYTYAAGACTMANNTGTPCFSSISLDRSTSPDSLVAAEYFDDGQGSRLFRYPFGSDYLLKSDSGGAVSATEAYRSGVANAQGVLSYNGRWYVAHSSATNHGQLWRLTSGAIGAAATCTVDGGSTHACWALHPEALSYWFSDGLVWSQTEWPNQRALFAVPLSSLP